jgi:hypothetical protein
LRKLGRYSLAPGSTIHFGSLDFIVFCFGHRSLSLLGRDSGAMFVGTVYNWLPSRCTPLEESSSKDDATSPGPRGCNVVTSMDPIVAAPIPESTPALQTTATITVWMMAPHPRMEPLLDQQQAYQEEQQARSHAR